MSFLNSKSLILLTTTTLPSESTETSSPLLAVPEGICFAHLVKPLGRNAQINGSLLFIEYWDADASAWIQLSELATNITNNDYTTCSNLQPFEAGLVINGFTATQLSGFKYANP